MSKSFSALPALFPSNPYETICARLLGRGSTAAAAARGRVLDATRLVVERSWCDSAALGGVDTESDPSKEAIGQLVTEVGELEEGIDTISGSLLGQDAVVGVGGDLLGVVTVGRDLVGCVDQVLVEERLADVARGDLIAEGAVGVDGGIGVDKNVDVGGAARLVAGEGRLELSNTVGIGGLDAAQPGLVDVGLVTAVTVSGGNNARVHTGGVAVPHLEVDVGHRLAGVDIDDLVVQDSVDSLLGLADIPSDVLATDIVRALSDVGGQNAGRVGGEEGRRVVVGGVAKVGGVVVGSQDGVKVPLHLEAALGASSLSSALATGGVPGLKAACLELS